MGHVKLTCYRHVVTETAMRSRGMNHSSSCLLLPNSCASCQRHTRTISRRSTTLLPRSAMLGHRQCLGNVATSNRSLRCVYTHQFLPMQSFSAGQDHQASNILGIYHTSRPARAPAGCSYSCLFAPESCQHLCAGKIANSGVQHNVADCMLFAGCRWWSAGSSQHSAGGRGCQ